LHDIYFDLGKCYRVRGDKHTVQYRYNYPYILVKKNCRFKWRTDAILDIVSAP